MSISEFRKPEGKMSKAKRKQAYAERSLNTIALIGEKNESA